MDSKVDSTILDNKVFEEMIVTEKSYNAALGFLNLALQIDVNVQHNFLLLEFRQAVSNLKDISDTLLEHAEKAVDMEVTEDEHGELRIQRTKLLLDFFRVYKPYARLFDQYISESAGNPKSFNIINYYVNSNSPGKLDLAALLIMPIQRGPRYSLLVREIRKRDEHLTETNKAEFKELEELITENLSSINSDLRAPEGYWFGKITYTLLFGNQDQPRMPTPTPTIANGPSTKRDYQFGDYTRWLVGTLFSARSAVAEVKPIAVASISSGKSETISEAINEVDTEVNEFVPLEQGTSRNPANEADKDTHTSSSLNF